METKPGSSCTAVSGCRRYDRAETETAAEVHGHDWPNNLPRDGRTRRLSGSAISILATGCLREWEDIARLVLEAQNNTMGLERSMFGVNRSRQTSFLTVRIARGRVI